MLSLMFLFCTNMDISETIMSCDIVCYCCRAYAENIRMRLSSNGMVAELMPVRGGGMDMNAVLSSAVQDAVRQRALFACIINEQNEMHRSITVNILHGQLQGRSLWCVIRGLLLPTRLCFCLHWFVYWLACSIDLLSTHSNRQGVDILFTVCLFVCVCLFVRLRYRFLWRG